MEKQNNEEKQQTTTNLELLSTKAGMTTGSRMNTNILEQKSRQIEPTQKGNEEVLERSYEETRRSSVQIRTTPPNILNVLIQMESDALGKVTIENTRKRKFPQPKRKPRQPRRSQILHSPTKHQRRKQTSLSPCIPKYVTYYKLTWKFPKYQQEAKHVQISTTQKVQMLIANTKNPLSMKIRISMETGIRPVELYNLHTKDINLETRKLYPTTAKHGSAHVFGT